MSNYAKISNLELWESVRAHFPTFAANTSEGTAELFTDRGYESLKASEVPNLLDEFYGLSLRVYLNQINSSHVKDKLEEQDFGEYYDQPFGGYIQRLAINHIKAVSPAYKELENYGSVDPYVVKKPEVTERFFVQNFDYQALLTVPDEYTRKTIFTNEYGMTQFFGALMEQVKNAYVIQKYVNKLEALNKAINSTKYKLQDTQKLEVAMSDEPTESELVEFVKLVKNTVNAMTIAPRTDAFNALHFASTQDKDRLKLLIRPQYLTDIDIDLMRNSYHNETLNMPIDIVQLENFGGLVPYSDAEYTTRVYPVYDKLGSVIGFNETEGADRVTVEESDVFYKDPNEDVVAIIADKGLIFETRQNGYTVEPQRNARGRYTNFWASSPNNSVNVDPLYNMVVIRKVAHVEA